MSRRKWGSARLSDSKSSRSSREQWNRVAVSRLKRGGLFHCVTEIRVLTDTLKSRGPEESPYRSAEGLRNPKPVFRGQLDVPVLFPSLPVGAHCLEHVTCGGLEPLRFPLSQVTQNEAAGRARSLVNIR